jgi:hypothetical protein
MTGTRCAGQNLNTGEQCYKQMTAHVKAQIIICEKPRRCGLKTKTKPKTETTGLRQQRHRGPFEGPCCRVLPFGRNAAPRIAAQGREPPGRLPGNPPRGGCSKNVGVPWCPVGGRRRKAEAPRTRTENEDTEHPGRRPRPPHGPAPPKKTQAEAPASRGVAGTGEKGLARNPLWGRVASFGPWVLVLGAWCLCLVFTWYM